MSSKDKDDTMSNEDDVKDTKDDLKEDLPEDMQVLDEVTENDDAPGNASYNEDDILEGDDQLDEEAEYLEAEDELAEDDLTEELADDDLHAEEENHDSEGEGDTDKKDDDLKEDEEETKKGDKPKEKADGAKSGSKDGADDEDVLQCPFGHTLRDDTNSNRYGCTPEECRRKDDPNIIGTQDVKKSSRDGREYGERLFLPNYKSFRIDMKVAAKIRSVVVGPLDLEDLQEEKVKAVISEADEFLMRFTRGDDKKCTGYVQFRFPTIEEAAASIERIEKIKDGLTVKQLIGPDASLADKLIRGFDGDDMEVPAETVKHLVSVCGIPTTTSKEQLTELFPQARLKLMAMKGNGTLKGYAYFELEDEDAAKKLVEEHNAKPHVLEGHKLYLEKMQANFELFMVIDSDDVLTDEERAKIVRTLNISQMSLDRRGTRMKAKEYHDLVRKVKMMKQKLAIDNRKRREKGMSLPKPPIRRPIGALGAPRAYGMTRGRGLGPRPARMEMRPRRDGISPRSSERAPPPPRSRPTHRPDERYHSGHPHTSTPRGDGYCGPPSSSRRDIGPPRRLDGDRGGRFSSTDRGLSRYSNSDRGRSGKLNTHQTANAVNMLVGLTSLLSEMQGRKPAAGGVPERRTSRPVASSDRWTDSYSERSRPRSSDYGAGYSGSSGRDSFRESGSSSYRDDWSSSRSESVRSSGGRGDRGGHSHTTSYDDSYYEERGARKRTLSDRGGYDDDYYRSDRGGMKRPKVMSRGRGGGPRGRY